MARSPRKPIRRWPPGEEVANAVGRSASVGRHDRVRVEMVRRPIDEDESGAGAAVGDQVALVGGRRRDDEPVDAASDELADEARSRSGSSSTLPATTVTRRGRAASSTARVTAADHGLARSSRTRPTVAVFPSLRRRLLAVEVRLVLELFDRPLDAGQEISGDGRLRIDDPRHGLEADAGQRGHVPHRRPGTIARIPSSGRLTRLSPSTSSDPSGVPQGNASTISASTLTPATPPRYNPLTTLSDAPSGRETAGHVGGEAT